MEIVEILSALRHCTSALGCDTCPMRAGIEQRAFCVATLLKESKTAITDLLAGIDASKRRCAQAQAERDAAIVDLKIFSGCAACKHCCNHRCYHQESLLLTCCDCTKKQNCKCVSCSLGRSNWEWRGLPEAPEEGEKA